VLQLRDMAARIQARVQADAAASALRGTREQAAQAAQQQLDMHIRCELHSKLSQGMYPYAYVITCWHSRRRMAECRAAEAQHQASRNAADAQAALAAERAATAASLVPALEAAKRAAAARRDFQVRPPACWRRPLRQCSKALQAGPAVQQADVPPRLHRRRPV
jgi:hypothetical protein